MIKPIFVKTILAVFFTTTVALFYVNCSATRFSADSSGADFTNRAPVNTESTNACLPELRPADSDLMACLDGSKRAVQRYTVSCVNGTWTRTLNGLVDYANCGSTAAGGCSGTRPTDYEMVSCPAPNGLMQLGRQNYLVVCTAIGDNSSMAWSRSPVGATDYYQCPNVCTGARPPSSIPVACVNSTLMNAKQNYAVSCGMDGKWISTSVGSVDYSGCNIACLGPKPDTTATDAACPTPPFISSNLAKQGYTTTCDTSTGLWSPKVALALDTSRCQMPSTDPGNGGGGTGGTTTPQKTYVEVLAFCPGSTTDKLAKKLVDTVLSNGQWVKKSPETAITAANCASANVADYVAVTSDNTCMNYKGCRTAITDPASCSISINRNLTNGFYQYSPSENVSISVNSTNVNLQALEYKFNNSSWVNAYFDLSTKNITFGAGGLTGNYGYQVNARGYHIFSGSQVLCTGTLPIKTVCNASEIGSNGLCSSAPTPTTSCAPNYPTWCVYPSCAINTGNPTSKDVPWTYNETPGACTYKCINGYSGTECKTAPVDSSLAWCKVSYSGDKTYYQGVAAPLADGTITDDQKLNLKVEGANIQDAQWTCNGNPVIAFPYTLPVDLSLGVSGFGGVGRYVCNLNVFNKNGHTTVSCSGNPIQFTTACPAGVTPNSQGGCRAVAPPVTNQCTSNLPCSGDSTRCEMTNGTPPSNNFSWEFGDRAYCSFRCRSGYHRSGNDCVPDSVGGVEKTSCSVSITTPGANNGIVKTSENFTLTTTATNTYDGKLYYSCTSGGTTTPITSIPQDTYRTPTSINAGQFLGGPGSISCNVEAKDNFSTPKGSSVFCGSFSLTVVP